MGPRLLTYKCGRASQLNCRYPKPYMYINNNKALLNWLSLQTNTFKRVHSQFFSVFFSFKLHDRTNIDTVSAKSQREIVEWT